MEKNEFDEIKITDPDRFLGADDLRKIHAQIEAEGGPQQTTDAFQTNMEVEEQLDRANINQSDRTNINRQDKNNSGQQSGSRPMQSGKSDTASQNRTNIKTKKKTKVKRRKSLLPARRKRKRRGFERRKKDHSYLGGMLRFLVKLLIFLAIVVLIYVGVRRYGNTVVQYAKDFIQSHTTTEETATPDESGAVDKTGAADGSDITDGSDTTDETNGTEDSKTPDVPAESSESTGDTTPNNTSTE